MIRCSSKGACGFTLFEILIAIFIFAIVVTTAFGSYVEVFSKAEAITERIAVNDMAKSCFDRIITDLQSAHASLPPQYQPPGINDDPDIFRIYSDRVYSAGTTFSRLRFTSLAHVQLEKDPFEGIAEIVYYVQKDGEDKHVLRRSDNLYPFYRAVEKPIEERGADPMLCENVKALEFTFFDAEGAEHDDWDSESELLGYATPRAVKVKLEVGDDSASHLFETMVYLQVYRQKKE